MPIYSLPTSSTNDARNLLLTAVLTSLLASASACGSDAKDDPGKGGSSAAGSSHGGTSSTAGKGSSGGTKSGGSAGSAEQPTLGGASEGGASSDDGGSGGNAESSGGSSAGTGGSSGGSGSGDGTLPGNGVWNCIEAGTSCICQNNGDPKSTNVCTGTYECCFAVPLGESTRCQCQDPGTSKCSDLAGVFGPTGKVVDHCPP